MDLNINELRLAAKHYFRKCPRTKQRLLALIELSKCTKSNRELRTLDYERVAVEFGVTARTLFRWKKSWDEKGMKGVVPKTSPGRKRFYRKKDYRIPKKVQLGSRSDSSPLKTRLRPNYFRR